MRAVNQYMAYQKCGRALKKWRPVRCRKCGRFNEFYVVYRRGGNVFMRCRHCSQAHVQPVPDIVWEWAGLKNITE